MRSKLMKIVTIGLFAISMVLNISVYFDSNDQNVDISLGSLKVNLFKKAYADDPPYTGGGGSGELPTVIGDWVETNSWTELVWLPFSQMYETVHYTEYTCLGPSGWECFNLGQTEIYSN